MRATLRHCALLLSLAGALAHTAHATETSSGVVSAKTEVAQLVRSMADSFRTKDYDGIMVSNRNGEMRSVRIVHVVRDGAEQERLEYLDGEPREIIRSAHSLDCIHAGNKLILSKHSGNLFGGIKAAGRAAMLGHYRLEKRSSSRVAGRDTHVVAVVPNDAYRFGRTLYIDSESHLLLKSEVLDQQAKVLEGFQFSQVRIGAEVDPAALDVTGEQAIRETFHALPPNGQQPLSSRWQLSWMPEGFVRSSHQKHSVGGRSTAVQSMHYTDGLAVFSLFIEPSKSAVEAFQTQSGSTTAYVSPKRIDKGWLAVTVVGEVPLAAAIKIAQSVSQAPDEAVSLNE